MGPDYKQYIQRDDNTVLLSWVLPRLKSPDRAEVFSDDINGYVSKTSLQVGGHRLWFIPGKEWTPGLFPNTRYAWMNTSPVLKPEVVRCSIAQQVCDHIRSLKWWMYKKHCFQPRYEGTAQLQRHLTTNSALGLRCISRFSPGVMEQFDIHCYIEALLYSMK